MLGPVLLFAALQASSSIQGVVREAGTREPVPYASVEIGSKRVTSDVRGFFIVSAVPDGTHRLQATALGYRAASVEVATVEGGVARVEILLETQPFEIAAIEVSAREQRDQIDVAGPPPVRIDPVTIDLVPGLAESDVLRTLQILPSVQQASDFSSALYVRGGAQDQTLVTLDGAVLFNPYHLGGIFAALDPDAVSTVDVSSGAIPARLGDRLSAAVSIYTREGSRDRVHGRGAVSMLSTRGAVDGPLFGGRGSFLVSARRTYLDLFTSAASAIGAIEKGIPYHFTDAHVKITRDVGELGQVSASMYVDEEQLASRDPLSDNELDDDFDWGSRAFSLSVRHPIGSRLLVEGRTALSVFRSEIDMFEREELTGDVAQSMRGRAYMRDAIVTTDLTRYHNTGQMRAGVQIDAYLLDYSVTRAEDRFFSDLLPELDSTNELRTFAAYVENEWIPFDEVEVRLGVRTFSAAGKTAVLPRFGAELEVVPRVSLMAGGGRYAQPLHSFRNEESLLASYLAYDVLIPADTFGVATGEDLVVGAEWRGTRTSVRLDAYGKRMNNLVRPPIPVDPVEAPLLVVNAREAARGNARGIELLVRHQVRQFQLWASYALTAARYRIGNDEFTPRFERRHSGDLFASTPWGERGVVSARFVFGTGQPFTETRGRFVPMAFNPRTNRFEPDFTRFTLGDHNDARLPNYWRVDVAAKRNVTRRWFGRSMELTPYVEIFNALNTRNVLIAEPTPFGEESPGPETRFTPQLPILPTLGLEWRF